MKAKLLKTDLSVIDVVPKNGTDFQLDELREFVGGYIEIVDLRNGQILVINEEGKLNDLPINALATNCIDLAFQGMMNDIIVGDALLCNSDMVK